MSFSSGVFTLVAGNPVVTGTTISSTVQNNTMNDIATGLSTCLLKDGTQTATAVVPFAQGINSTLVTDSTSSTTGSIITAGGIGIAKALNVGTNITASGTITSTGTVFPLGLVDASAAGAGQIKFPATQNPSANANTLDDYVEGQWTATLTGCTTAPTYTVNYVKIGNMVTMHFPTIGATSNATTKTLTGMPVALRPTAKLDGFIISAFDNNAADVYARLDVLTSGVVDIYPNAVGGNWTASGTMGIYGFNITYALT